MPISDNKTKIIIAVFTFLGLVIPALFISWDSIFHPHGMQEKDSVSEVETVKYAEVVEKIESLDELPGIDKKDIVKIAYFELLTTDISAPNSIDFDKNTNKIGYSRKPHMLYLYKLEDIGVKIGIVQIDKVKKTVTAKLTRFAEHFDNADGRTMNNWKLGDTKIFVNEGRILKIKFYELNESGRGGAYFNIKSWEK